MSDLIFYTNGEETSCIPFPTPGTKCPETKLEIKMTESDISKVLIEGDYATIMGVKYKRVEEPKTPVEEAYKEWWGQYPELETDSEYDDMRWQGFQAGYELAQPKAVPVDDPPEYDEIEWDEKDNSKPMDEVVNKMLKKWEENPPDFLKFELGKTLEDLITRWWLDTHTVHKDWDVPTCVDDLIDQIQLWLPREQSHEGTQDVSVIDLVDGYNDCLTKIKSKLRNKR